MIGGVNSSARPLVLMMVFCIIFGSTTATIVSSPSLSKNEILVKNNSTNIVQKKIINNNLIIKESDVRDRNFLHHFEKICKNQNISTFKFDEVPAILNYREHCKSFEEIFSYFDEDDRDNSFQFLRRLFGLFPRIPYIIFPGMPWNFTHRDITIYRDIIIMPGAKLDLYGTAFKMQDRDGDNFIEIMLGQDAELNINKHVSSITGDVVQSYITSDNNTFLGIVNNGGKIFCNKSIISIPDDSLCYIINYGGSLEFSNNVNIYNVLFDFWRQPSGNRPMLLEYNTLNYSQILIEDSGVNIINNTFNNGGINCWETTRDLNFILENNTFEGDTYLDIPYTARKSIPNMKHNWINGLNFDGHARENDTIYFYNKDNVVIDGKIMNLNQDNNNYFTLRQGLITLYDCDNFTIQNSQLSNNIDGTIFPRYGMGIYCKNSTGNIYDCTVQNNVYGIVCENSILKLRDNILIDNTYGISIPYNSKMTIPYMQRNMVNGVNIDGCIYPEEKCYYYNEKDLIIKEKIEDCGYSEYYRGSLTKEGIITLYDCDNITISNCDLRWGEIGVYSVNSHSTIICNTLHETNYGISLLNNSTTSIYNNNKIFASYRGISIIDSYALKIEGNEISSGLYGIYLENAGSYPFNRISGNKIYDNRISIYCESCDPIISDNEIVGIRPQSNSGEGIQLIYAEPKIYNNSISQCYKGIEILYGSYPEIKKKNDIFENDIGIYCADGGDAFINDNYIYNNNKGITLNELSLNPLINHNDIFHNAHGIDCTIANPNITFNNFSNSVDINIHCNQDCKPIIQWNNFNLDDIALYLKKNVWSIDATSNYWGHESGPSGFFYGNHGAKIEGLYADWSKLEVEPIDNAGCYP